MLPEKSSLRSGSMYFLRPVTMPVEWELPKYLPPKQTMSAAWAIQRKCSRG